MTVADHRRRLRRALAGLMLATGVASATSASAGKLFVYEGNGSDGRKALPAFERLLGRRVDGVVDFVAFDSWDSFDRDAEWGLGGWKGAGYELLESVPLAVKGTSLAEVAQGQADAHFRKLGALLVRDGFASSYVRLGWEFNGGWYPWSFKGREKDYIAAFRHVALLMRQVPGQHFRFVWCPAQGMQQQWPDLGWPGDDVVDVVAMDVYNQSWTDGTRSAPNEAAEPAMWRAVKDQSWGLQSILDFAAKHGKPLAFPEWGTGDRPDGHGGGDDPVFIQNMAPIVARADLAGYWDYNAGDYNAKVSSGQRPLAAAALIRLYAKGAEAQAKPPGAAQLRSASASPSPPPTEDGPLRAWVDRGAKVVVRPASDGGAVLELSFPPTPRRTHYTVWLSTPRRVETWGRLGQLGWDTSGGTAHVRIGAD